MKHKIVELPVKKLVGMRISTTLANDENVKLWKTFMPRRKEIQHIIKEEYLGIQIYDENLDFRDFTPNTTFERWAAIEVSEFEKIPEGMEINESIGGKYAVFRHKGPVSTFQKTMGYIFGVWLPNSNYALDNRAHFQVMGDAYSNTSPDSEEDVYIPIKELEK